MRIKTCKIISADIYVGANRSGAETITCIMRVVPTKKIRESMFNYYGLADESNRTFNGISVTGRGTAVLKPGDDLNEEAASKIAKAKALRNAEKQIRNFMKSFKAAVEKAVEREKNTIANLNAAIEKVEADIAEADKIVLETVGLTNNIKENA